ncbi:unnamed protein product [Brassica oleracea var. botrytis]|uniref:(rape) hypothetical protein n=2 Tax=Brassica TaxID=3705 RepID=A0A816IGI4_BRANA|nr:unnamed protein product [Brassica napus]
MSPVIEVKIRDVITFCFSEGFEEIDQRWELGRSLAPPPSRCRPPPDPPPSKLLSVAFETLTSIIPPEPPDPPDSFFVLVHRLRPLASFSSDFHSVSLGILTQAWDFKSPLSDLAINSIGSAASPRPSYLSNKPCEGIVSVPLWNKSFLRKVHCDVCLLKLYLPQCEDVTVSLTLRMRSSLPLYEDDELHLSTLLPRYEDVLRTSIMLALFHHGSALWSLGLMSMSLSPFPLWLVGKKNLLVGLSGVVTGDIVLKMVISDAETMTSLALFSAIFDTDLLAMMALETLMSLLFEIVWNCQDAKDVSLALVRSSLMVGALMLCSVLPKAKELSLLRFHIFSDPQVFISTLSLGSVLNEIACVLRDGRSLATLFNPLSFSFIPCIDYVHVVSLANSLECMIVENFVFSVIRMKEIVDKKKN